MQRYLKTTIITLVSFVITASLVHAVGNFYYDVADDGFVIQNVPVLEVNSLIAESRGTNNIESDLTITGKNGPVVFKLDADNNDTNAKLSILDGQKREIARFQENGILRLFGHMNETTPTSPQIHLGDRWVIGENGGPSEDFIVYDKNVPGVIMRIDDSANDITIEKNFKIGGTFTGKTLSNENLLQTATNTLSITKSVNVTNFRIRDRLYFPYTNTANQYAYINLITSSSGGLRGSAYLESNVQGFRVKIPKITNAKDVCTTGSSGKCLTEFSEKKLACNRVREDCGNEADTGDTNICEAFCQSNEVLMGGGCWAAGVTESMVYHKGTGASTGREAYSCTGMDIDYAYAYCCKFE